ncbi:MAG: type III secretion system translocon subunit SctE [Thermodesulforhabdaceae bacterium]
MVDNVKGASIGSTTMTTEATEYDSYVAEASKKLLTLIDQDPSIGAGTGSDETDKPSLTLPGVSVLDVANMLASIKSQINESLTGIAKTNIEKNRADQQQKTQERIKQLEEAAEAMHKANTWGTIGKILGWAIPALMVVTGAALAIAGAVVLATGVGAAAGIALLSIGASLIAGGVVGLVAQTLQETGAAKAIMDWMASKFEEMGMSKEAAMWTSLIVYQVVVMAIMIAASAGAGLAVGFIGGLVGGGVGAASSAVGAGAQAAATAASTGAQVASTSAQTAANFAINAIRVGIAVAQGLAQVGQAGVSLGQAINEKDAADHEANAQTINAFLKKLQQKLEEQEDDLKEIMEAYQRGIDVIMNIIQTQDQMAHQAIHV